MDLPVLLVHGIWDAGLAFDRLVERLEGEGAGPIATIDLRPNDGSAPIERLARQVKERAGALGAAAGTARVDVVGFSMGALVCRYWIQRLGGRGAVRRFVSVSGPHRGTATAFAMGKAGVRQMRPGSALLADLEADEDPWGDVEVHTLWTPFDLMIVPARSSRLEGAASEQRVRVPLHRWMITHDKALDAIVAALRGAVGTPPRPPDGILSGGR